jgi:N-carbamoyl-L-amino-acid hydrolase
MSASASSVVDPRRTVAELRELAALTSDEHGAQRVAFTPTWAAARTFLAERLDALGVSHDVDEAGNMWATVPGERDEAVVIGGHLDSVPNGGWLDGTLNVLAGLEVVRRLMTMSSRPVTVRLVDWADEEGARFGGRSMFGSSVATGAINPVDMGDLTDNDGVTLSDAAAEYGIDLGRAARARQRLEGVAAYIELHVEQGPVLEERDAALAAVTGTIGIERHLLRITGQADHAGTASMDRRVDAFLAGARVALVVREVAIAAGGSGTCGRLSLVPGVPTVVPGQCEMSIDLRHYDQAALRGMVEEVRSSISMITDEEGVGFETAPIMQVPAVAFDPTLVAHARDVVNELSGTLQEMPGPILHDATRIAQSGVPTAMLFVQSLGGLSHTKEEDTRPEHIELSVQALDALVERTIQWVADRP